MCRCSRALQLRDPFRCCGAELGANDGTSLATGDGVSDSVSVAPSSGVVGELVVSRGSLGSVVRGRASASGERDQNDEEEHGSRWSANWYDM